MWNSATQNHIQLPGLSIFIAVTYTHRIYIPLPIALKDHGWSIENGILEVQWDSPANQTKVKQTIQILSGCKCKMGCGTKQCSCKKSKRINFVDPAVSVPIV